MPTTAEKSKVNVPTIEFDIISLFSRILELALLDGFIIRYLPTVGRVTAVFSSALSVMMLVKLVIFQVDESEMLKLLVV